MENACSFFVEMQNPVRANVMTIMKNRIIELEEENERLVKNRYVSTFCQIVDLMGNKTHHETVCFLHLSWFISGTIFTLLDNIAFHSISSNLKLLNCLFLAFMILLLGDKRYASFRVAIPFRK
jgi:hypothetical protein